MSNQRNDGPPPNFWDWVNSFQQAAGNGVDSHGTMNWGPETDFSRFAGPRFSGGRGRGPRGPWGSWGSWGPMGPTRNDNRRHGPDHEHDHHHGSDHEHDHHHRHDDNGEVSDENDYEKNFEDSESDHEKRKDVHTPNSDREMPDQNTKVIEKDSLDTMRGDVPDPEEVVLLDDNEKAGSKNRGTRRDRSSSRRRRCAERRTRRGEDGEPSERRGCGGRRGGRGRGHHHGPMPHRGPHHGPHGPHGPPPPPVPPFANIPAAIGEAMRNFTGHPFWQNAGRNVDGNGNVNRANASGDSFSPPVDTFNSPTAYVLHVALPGVKKEDVGVNWNGERGLLQVSGVVHRPGDEEFLKTLHSEERRIGMFERDIVLPPAGIDAHKEQIDETGITARMEDGVLIVHVPKMEKEWSEVRKVDIQ